MVNKVVNHGYYHNGQLNKDNNPVNDGNGKQRLVIINHSPSVSLLPLVIMKTTILINHPLPSIKTMVGNDGNGWFIWLMWL